MENRILSLDYFLALSNIIKELRFLGYYEPINVWKEYCRKIEEQEKHRIGPAQSLNFEKFLGFSLSDIRMLYSNKGFALVLYHYGAHRHVAQLFIEEMHKLKADKDILLIVDSESYSTEKNLKLWGDFYEEMRVKMVIAERPEVGLQMAKHVKNGGVIIVYLDGLTGVGDDLHPILLPFISSTIEVRSGLFRFLNKFNIPAIGAIESNDAEITVSRPILSKDINFTASSLMSFFRVHLINNPAKWRLWYRHHKFIKDTPNILGEDNYKANAIWSCNEVKPTLILEEEKCDIYEYMDENK